VAGARLLFFLSFVLLAFSRVGPARGSDILELIDIYRDAVKSRHAGAIEAAGAALTENSSAMNYIMANDPDLFSTLKGASSASVMVGRDEPAGPAENNADRKAPDHQAPEPRAGRNSRAGGARKIKQQLLQYENGLRARLEEESFHVTVSGVGEVERQALGRLFSQEFDLGESVKETGYKAGLVEYRVGSDRVGPEELAGLLDNRRVGSFTLDMTRFSPRRIDFILKF
jgi:hypothetical protein